MSRVAGIEQSIKGAQAEASAFKRGRQFSEKTFAIDAAYEVGKATVSAINTWNAASWKAEVGKIDATYDTAYEKSKKVTELNKEFQFATMFNPDLALAQMSVLDGNGFTKLGKTEQGMQERLFLDQISQSISKKSNAKEFYDGVTEIEQQHKKMYPNPSPEFEYYINDYKKNAEAIYNYPTLGRKNYINNLNYDMLKKQVDTIFSTGEVKTKADVDKAMALIRKQPYSPEYGGNVEKQALGMILDKSSSETLTQELMNDPEYSQYFNDDEFAMYQADALEKANAIQVKKINQQDKMRRDVLEANKRGKGLPTAADLSVEEARVNNYLMNNPVYSKTTEEIDTLLKTPEIKQDTTLKNALTITRNYINSEWEKDAVKVMKDPKLNVPIEALSDITIVELEKEGERIPDRAKQEMLQSLESRYRGFNLVRNGYFKGDPTKINFLSEAEQNKMIDLHNKAPLIDSWDFDSQMIEGLTELQNATPDSIPNNWGTAIGKALGDEIYGEYLNKARIEGGNYKTAYIKSRELEGEDAQSFKKLKGFINSAVSSTLPPELQYMAEFLSDYGTANLYEKDKSFTLGDLQVSQMRSLKTAESYAESEAIREAIQDAMVKDELGFYVVRGNQKVVTSKGWFWDTKKAPISYGSFVLKSGSQYESLVETLSAKTEEIYVDDKLKKVPITELNKYGYVISVENAGMSFNDFKIAVYDNMGDAIQNKNKMYIEEDDKPNVVKVFTIPSPIK